MTNPTPPGQVPQQPAPASVARTVMLDQVSFDRKPDCYGIRQITDDESVEEWEDIRTSPDVAREEANDMMATGRGEIYEVVPLWTTPQPSPTAQAAESVPAPVLDMAVMQLAESVGLIGPASRVHDLHAAIQRFHDLICVNATIKAAVMAADAISGAAAPAQDYPPLPMQFACSGVFPVYSADQMRTYVDTDRAARAPADSVGRDAEDAARWRMLPAFFEEYQIDAMKLYRDIDSAMAANGGNK